MKTSSAAHAEVEFFELRAAEGFEQGKVGLRLELAAAKFPAFGFNGG